MTITRRSVIRGAGAAGSLLLAGGLPLWARGEQSPDEPAPADYVRLSAALLGVDAARLEPDARAGETPLADTFHALCREAAPAATAALLAAWREAAGDGGAGPRGAAAPGSVATPGSVAAPGSVTAAAGGPAPAGSAADRAAAALAAAGRLLADGGRPRADDVGALARLTMLMWLYGVWYGGTETARMPGSAAVIGPDHRTDLVVSVRAYRNGWIWRLAEARPMGVAGAPGAWAQAPPGLDAFLDGA